MNLSPKAQASIERVIDKFKWGNLGLITDVVRIQLNESAPASKWSLSNRALAYFQAGEIDCRGFQQWRDAGRQVKKGSVAAYIVSPRMLKVRKDKHEVVEEDEERNEMKLVGYTTIPVFGAGSTEGEGQIAEYAPKEFPPLFDVAKKLGVEVKYGPTPEDRLGDCNHIGTVIRLGTYGMAVFFHELAHAVHARIEGPLSGKHGKKERQEIIAEFIAAVLMDFYGYDYSGSAWSYISKFAKDPLLAITTALKTVEQILEVIERAAEEGGDKNDNHS